MKIDCLIAGDNLLGTEARLRRIRSANNRFITTRRRSRNVDDDLSSTSSTSMDRNPRYQSLLNGHENSIDRPIESRECSIEAINSQIKQNGPCETMKAKVQKKRPKTARNRYVVVQNNDHNEIYTFVNLKYIFEAIKGFFNLWLIKFKVVESFFYRKFFILNSDNIILYIRCLKFTSFC